MGISKPMAIGAAVVTAVLAVVLAQPGDHARTPSEEAPTEPPAATTYIEPSDETTVDASKSATASSNPPPSNPPLPSGATAESSAPHESVSGTTSPPGAKSVEVPPSHNRAPLEATDSDRPPSANANPYYSGRAPESEGSESGATSPMPPPLLEGTRRPSNLLPPDLFLEEGERVFPSEGTENLSDDELLWYEEDLTDEMLEEDLNEELDQDFDTIPHDAGPGVDLQQPPARR